MRAAAKLAFPMLLMMVSLGAAIAQRQSASKTGPKVVSQSSAGETGDSRFLTDEDRLSLIVAALDSRARGAEPDCSHLVHTIYQRAGFAYGYAPSSDLYAGVDGFQRVTKPEPGDLVVWRGHVGIVIKPSEHLFFSVLSSGAGIDDYTTKYWKHRGKLRFYRYLKAPSPRPESSPQLVRANRVRRAPDQSDPPNSR
jgi:hypothetical protein